MPVRSQIAQAIARHLGHQWDEVLLDGTAPEGLGDHPWDFRPPIILSTVASLELGYEPVGPYAETVPHQVDWLLATAASGADPVAHDPPSLGISSTTGWKIASSLRDCMTASSGRGD